MNQEKSNPLRLTISVYLKTPARSRITHVRFYLGRENANSNTKDSQTLGTYNTR